MCASQKQNYGPIFDLELMQITPMYSPHSLILKPIATKNELKRFPAWNNNFKKMVLKIQKNKCKWLVGSVSWTSAKPNFTNCPLPILHPMHLMICSLMKSQWRVYSGLQLKPYKASAMGIFWYEQLNNVKCIYPVSSIYRFPGYIQDTRSDRSLWEQEIPWCHVAPVWPKLAN